MKFVVCFDLFGMDFHLGVKIDFTNADKYYKCYFLSKSQFFFWKKLKKPKLLIENSGFVKTCDEHIHSEDHGWPSQEEF